MSQSHPPAVQPVTTYTTSSPPSHSSHPSPDDDSTIRRSESLSLSRLTGVNGADTSVDEFERRARHGKPRLRFTATHALAAILIMTFVTCMSLTLLIQQSINYAAIGGADGVQDTQGTTTDADRSKGEDRGPNGENDGSGGTVTGGENDSRENGGQDDAKGSDANDTSGTPSAPELEPAPNPDPADTRLDLNTATLEQLDAIPGIGPVTAQKILDHRQRIGRFTSVDQLLDVSGIGAKTLEKIRPKVRV